MSEDAGAEGGGEAHVEWWIYFVIITLSCTSALSNAWNIGLMGLDQRYLELMTKGPFETKKDEEEAKLAEKILPLRRKGNQMIITILFGTVASNTIVSILMADIEGNLSGFLISTAIITLFGEIVPQTFANKYGLKISAYSRWLIYIAFYAIFIFSYPIAAILDKVLGEEAGHVLTKSRMKKLFETYEKKQMLKPSERKLLSAALELKERNAGQAMTPLSKAFMLDINQNLDENLKRTIYSQGYSRIPIYEGKRENIIGILMARDLIITSIDDSLFTIKQLSSILVRDVIAIDQGTKLEPLLTFFKEQKCETHMAIVTKIYEQHGKDPELQRVGILTLEDIIEELLQEEIEDEREIQDIKGERRRLKEKLVRLFADNQAGQLLNQSELFAICEFLEHKVEPFNSGRIDRTILDSLVSKSEVFTIESDGIPFSHNLDNLERDGYVYKEEYVNIEQVKFQQHLMRQKAEKEKYDNPLGKKKKKPKTEKTSDTLTDNPFRIVKNDLLEMNQENAINDGDGMKLQEFDVPEMKDSISQIDVPEEEYYSPKKKIGYVQTEIINEDINPILFVRNVPSSHFYLILSGIVSICSGQEGFMVELGPFNCLGVDSLLQNEYKPDFSAKVLNTARLLRITKREYMAAVSNIKNHTN